MGDPRRARRRYDTPTHPWQGERIKDEDEYVRKFGLKNKRELWRHQTQLRRFRGQARHLLPGILRGSGQAQKEADQVLSRLNKLGILDEGSELADVLALNVDSILGRRLQTVVYRKGLARTPKQARQLIVHGHIGVGGRRVDVPSYLVPREEETVIEYASTSSLTNEAHPARPERAGPAQGILEEQEASEDETPSEPEPTTAAERAGEAEPDDAGEDEGEGDASQDEGEAEADATEDTAEAETTEETPDEGGDDDTKEGDA